MGLRDWRTRRALKDPVPGQFQVTGRYFLHPNGNSFREMLTGVLTGPGITATAGEHLDDIEGRWVGQNELPALIDRADPTRFIVLWEQLPKPDYRAQARADAEQAARAAQTRPGGPASSGLSADSSPTTAATTAESASTSTFVYGAGGDVAPAWASEMIADLTRKGLIPADHDTAGRDPQTPIMIQLPNQVLDLSAGRITASDAARLMTEGDPGTAVLLTVTDVDVLQQALPGPTASLCDLTVRVTAAGRASYVAQTRLGFRNADRRAAIAVIGSTLPVRIDPHDRTRVVIDSVTYDAQHPSRRDRPGRYVCRGKH